jgi:DNA replication protein DnaC
MSDTLVMDRIESNLVRLKLSRISDILSDLTKTAQEQGKSYLTFLDELLEEEVAAKEQRRIETSLKYPAFLISKALMSLTSPSSPAWINKKLWGFLI